MTGTAEKPGAAGARTLGPAIEAEGYGSALRRGVALASAFLTEAGA